MMKQPETTDIEAKSKKRKMGFWRSLFLLLFVIALVIGSIIGAISLFGDGSFVDNGFSRICVRLVEFTGCLRG